MGDKVTLDRQLSIKPWQMSPFEVTAEPPYDRRTPWGESWDRAQELRDALIAIAGQPGRVGRHGQPLGKSGAH